MKKMALTLAVLLAITSASQAAISVTWGWTGLSGNINNDPTGPYTAGWLVQLYRDVGGDSVLGSITGFGSSGIAGSVTGTGTSTDVMVGSMTSALDSFLGDTYWGRTDMWDSYAGWTVYTVIFNSDSAATATQAIVLDSSVYTVPSSDTTTDYSLNSVGNGWVPVPEPASLALMGIGAAVLGIRKALRK